MTTSALPPLLLEFAASGLWRTSGAHVDPRIPAEVVQRLDPFAAGIHLEDAFQTVADEAEQSPEFWRDFGRLDDPGVLDFLIIGDFGLGSDSPIVLDCRPTPAVVRMLKWLDPGEGGRTSPSTRWAVIADSFDEFARMIGADAWLDGPESVSPVGSGDG